MATAAPARISTRSTPIPVQQLWRTYTVPAPGEPGSETWKDKNNAWKHGGGSYWQTGSYDPATKLTIWGTGQPVPMFDPEYRPGDNLFTNSTVGFDVNTGKMKWYFQYTPGDFLDYDEVGINQLIDTKVNGEDRKIVAHFGRNGFFYTLDRTNGQFVSGAAICQKAQLDGRHRSKDRQASRVRSEEGPADLQDRPAVAARSKGS